MTIFFNDALKAAAKILFKAQLTEGLGAVLIRDVHGRIRIALDAERKDHLEVAAEIEASMVDLGAFASSGSEVIFREDLFDADTLFSSPDILEVFLPGAPKPIRLIDRQITGEDWLRPSVRGEVTPPRLVFYGLKGGVGRSTALTILAYELARSGKRVLLIDLDLESPGLSGLLLPPDSLSKFGLVDWFIEDGVDQGDYVLDNMISYSPLSDTCVGEIRVAAAMGIDEPFYLSKLSRVYADAPQGAGGIRFSQRVERLVKKIEAREKPDVVLIDSRAGLHDLAAISIVNLATKCFLFANDTTQTWLGYRLLFSHWQSHPAVLRDVRDKLVLVEALFPEADQAARADKFLEKSYTLFSETLYEIIEPGFNSEADLFNFDLGDDSAPHFPLRIKWNSRFQEFDPIALKDILTGADIAATFGHFLDGANRLIEEELNTATEGTEER